MLRLWVKILMFLSMYTPAYLVMIALSINNIYLMIIFFTLFLISLYVPIMLITGTLNNSPYFKKIKSVRKISSVGILFTAPVLYVNDYRIYIIESTDSDSFIVLSKSKLNKDSNVLIYDLSENIFVARTTT